MNQRDRTILLKITDYCLQIRDTHDYYKHDKKLLTNEKFGFIYRNSITMQILQIGEIAKMLSEELLGEYTEIPWMRDIVAHHYGSLDYGIVWNTSVSDIPGLCMGIKEILQR